MSWPQRVIGGIVAVACVFGLGVGVGMSLRNGDLAELEQRLVVCREYGRP